MMPTSQAWAPQHTLRRQAYGKDRTRESNPAFKRLSSRHDLLRTKVRLADEGMLFLQLIVEEGRLAHSHRDFDYVPSTIPVAAARVLFN